MPVDERDHEREEEHRAIDRDAADSGNAARAQRLDRTDRQVRQQEPEAAAGQGEDDAFGEHLEDEAPAAGAERGADGDFLAAHRRAHQQQVGDVGARDQDDDGDGREQRQQRRPDARDDAFLQADDFSGFVRAVLGILHRQPFGDGLHLGAGLLQR